MTDDAGLPALLDAIRHLEGVEATWVESVPVHETHDGQTVWAGEVQVFDIAGHPKAKRAYAWCHATTGTKPCSQPGEASASLVERICVRAMRSSR